MAVLIAIYANLSERFIFNFRLNPDDLASHLPVAWLKPQIFNGFGVVSFCILKLEHLVLWPLPKFFGFETISCAYRCGVIDHSREHSEPSVYITDRNTDQSIVARFGPILFSDSMPMVRTDIARMPEFTEIHASYLDGQGMFMAEVRPSNTPNDLQSKLFKSLEEYVNFIKGGISSYTPSIYHDKLARVDLHKEDTEYEVVDAKVDFSVLDGVWREAHLVFDSAVRATGGYYKWTYRGLVSKRQNWQLAEIKPEVLKEKRIE